eukprot:CAMPEP_0118955992 /NCGR_PEP_ID=MMETSP1169-20130426/60872_1 /TAXON_ID=36882 /ORGANISM="Pyramimonas obovata, Strain CCMP722" /LENGTH=236 /DNA_ID=CAMNT_0006903933 /DNA_START=312 /DNA_END=1019 /DNA_ORIENTATION=-
MTRMICALDASGSILLSRVYGAPAPEAFRTLVLLMSSSSNYAQHNGFDLRRLHSADCKLVFRRCKDDLLLILVTNDLASEESSLQTLLEAVLNGIVLILGDDTLFGRGSSQNRKRALARAAPLIDTICSEDGPPLGLALGCVEMHPGDFEGADNRREMTKALQAFAQEADVEVAILFVNGCIRAATAHTWSLPPAELQLLQVLMWTLPSAASRELPVHLPLTAPGGTARLVTCQLA